MAEENLGQIQKQIRSPRSAALAGIIFSVLMVASMLLLSNSTTQFPGGYQQRMAGSQG